MPITVTAGKTLNIGTILLTPAVGLGRVQGYVIDAVSQSKIYPAKITVDDTQKIWTYQDGSYRTDFLPYGIHKFVVSADNYETGTFQINIDRSLINYNFALSPLSPAPTPWTKDVSVEDMWAEPNIIFLGETVTIKVYVQAPRLDLPPWSYPTTIQGTVLVDSYPITQTFTITHRNPTLEFPFTPTTAGIYTARAQDKSTSFEVRPAEIGVYYDPFGSAFQFNSEGELLQHMVSARNWPPCYACRPTSLEWPPKDYRWHIATTDIYSWPGNQYRILCPICKADIFAPVPEGYTQLMLNVIDHVKTYHPDYPFNVPKGGLLISEPVNYWGANGYYWMWYFTGLILPPGSHSGQVTVQLRSRVETVTVPYNITIPDWGDRVYLNALTGETALVRWSEIPHEYLPCPSVFETYNPIAWGHTSPPSQMKSKTVGIYYIWHYSDDYDPNWRDTLRPGLELALNRLARYFGNIWNYQIVAEYRTTRLTGGGHAIGREEEYAVSEWGVDYSQYDIPIFVFANTREAYSVNYTPPIYMSDNTFLIEASEKLVLIEHEIGHIFGLPDHMKPFTNPEYENCIMGNLYLPEVRFCSECQAILSRKI